MKKRIIVIIIAVITGFALASILALANKHLHAKRENPAGLIAVTDKAFGGPFTLTDHNGKTVTEKDFAGKYKLMYFGFTYCPAICPTELSTITNALKALGDKAEQVQPIFITVDPERDTPEKLKNYVTLFHPSLVGLSGTPEQTKKVLKEFKIYAAKRQDPSMSEYTMDHSTYVYFMAPDGRLLHIFKMGDPAEDMKTTISQWLDQESQ